MKSTEHAKDIKLIREYTTMLTLESQVKKGARWFFWIAILSLLNSTILMIGGNWNFIVGLGITQTIDGTAMGLAEPLGTQTGMAAKIVAFHIDLIAAAIFIVFGLFSRKGKKVPFVIGMMLYSLDGLILLKLGDYLSFGFHIFALYWLCRGFKAAKQFTVMQQSIQSSSV